MLPDFVMISIEVMAASFIVLLLLLLVWVFIAYLIDITQTE